MKNIYFLPLLLANVIGFSQIAFTSFEEPPVFTIEYTDTGDPNVAHDLINNSNEPLVDFSTTGSEIGFDARYEPYDSPGTGLSDGDAVGVTDEPPTNSNPYTDGLQGYQLSDIDGNFILEFDPITTGGGSHELTIDYFISETGYEGDGTSNTSGSDRLRIYVKDLTNITETDILNTTGNDINDLGIEGFWISGIATLLPNITAQLVIEARTNSGAESFYLDNIIVQGPLNIENSEENLFAIVPNPATSDHVNIVSRNAGAIEITVYDLLGNSLIKKLLNSQKLDVSMLNSGVYILEIKQGSTVSAKKLVIQ